MQAYYPSSAAHGHVVIPTIPITSMQAYHPSTTAHTLVIPTSMQAYYPSTAAHTLVIPTSMQAYYPSTAAHTHLDISTIPTPETPPPSPTASEILASLQNPENLSDTDLLERTLNAQSTLLKWQNEYLANDRDIRRATTGLCNKGNKPKARQLQDPAEYERSRDKAVQDAMLNPEISSRGRKLTKTANASLPKPAKQPVPKVRKPRTTTAKRPQPPKITTYTSSKPKPTIPKEPPPPKPTIASTPKPEKQPAVTIPKDLLIDMNAPQPAQIVGKRTRQPRKIFDSPPASAPKATIARAATPSIPPNARPVRANAGVKRAHSPSIDEGTPDEAPQPPAKKRTGTPSIAGNARPVRAKAAAVKEETPAPARSKGDVMREVWAKRQAEGRNGRHGGAPKPATVAKARVKVGGR